MASTQTTETLKKICPRCTEVATKLCGTCKDISYCSLECQQADWPVHQSVCKLFKAFTTPRPAPDMRRVIVFLTQNKTPQFEWVRARELAGGEHIHPRDLFKHPESVSWRPIETRRNGWTNMNIGYSMQVWHDDGFLGKFPPNLSLLGATLGLDAAGWCGPMMVCCESFPETQSSLFVNENDREGVEVLDMDTLAFSHLASFLIDHSNDTLEHLFCMGPKVQGIEMACGLGPKSTEAHTEAHKVVRLPRTHPFFQGQGVLSGISKQLGEPLITWEVPTKTSARRNNPKIVVLHVCCDPTLREGSEADVNVPSFGLPDMRFNLDVGTHLVARADSQPLTGETVDAMVDFCRYHLMPYFQRCAESGDFEDLDEMSPRRIEHRQKVMEQITPEKWKTYLTQWKAEQIDKSEAASRGGHAYTIEKASAGVERMGLSEDDCERVTDILFNMRKNHLDLYKSKYGWD